MKRLLDSPEALWFDIIGKYLLYKYMITTPNNATEALEQASWINAPIPGKTKSLLRIIFRRTSIKAGALLDGAYL